MSLLKNALICSSFLVCATTGFSQTYLNCSSLNFYPFETGRFYEGETKYSENEQLLFFKKVKVHEDTSKNRLDELFVIKITQINDASAIHHGLHVQNIKGNALFSSKLGLLENATFEGSIDILSKRGAFALKNEQNKTIFSVQGDCIP